MYTISSVKLLICKVHTPQFNLANHQVKNISDLHQLT